MCFFSSFLRKRHELSSERIHFLCNCASYGIKTWKKRDILGRLPSLWLSSGKVAVVEAVSLWSGGTTSLTSVVRFVCYCHKRIILYRYYRTLNNIPTHRTLLGYISFVRYTWCLSFHLNSLAQWSTGVTHQLGRPSFWRFIRQHQLSSYCLTSLQSKHPNGGAGGAAK